MTAPNEATTNPAAARVQVIPAPIVSPGVCGICGKTEHPEGFADLRLDFEWYGTLYFCADCVGAIARPFHFISIEQYQDMLDTISTLDAKCQRFADSYEKLVGFISEQRDAVNRSVLTDDGVGPLDSNDFLPFDDEGVTSSVANADEGTSESATGESSGTAKVMQLSSKQISVRVPSDSSGDDDTDPIGI